MSREAIKLALEALEYTTTVANFLLGNEKDIGPMLKAREAITALREALAEQPAQQEPVAWIVEFENGEQELHFEAQSVGEKNTPLYTSQAQQKPYRLLQDNGSKYFGESWDKAEQPAHAPVEWMEMVVANLVREGVNKHKARELTQHFYTSPQPAQRTWVGLTDEEFQMIYDMGRTPAGMMEMVEAKLKEKNT